MDFILNYLFYYDTIDDTSDDTIDDTTITYFNKNISYLTNSNISLQNSDNSYRKNILLNNNYILDHNDLIGWTSKISLFNSHKYKLIKKVYNQKIDKNILIENFNNEVNSLILMKGEKHIPIIYGIDSTNLSIIMEYCGEKLNIDNCPTDWKSQFIEIFNILREYHIYHNDIHSLNFCIKNKIIYIIDFGIAKNHIDWQYQNLSIDVIENSNNIEEMFSKIRSNGIEIRKCLFCDDNYKNI